MAQEDRNVLARFGIPVAVKYDDYKNKFVVTEVPRPDSTSSQARQDLEQELTDVIRKQLFNDPSAIRVPPAVNQFVAVRRGTHAFWSRGQVQDIYHMYQKTTLRIFLLDWGDSQQFLPADVVPLPRTFLDKPCFARTAELFGICPLSKELDPLTLQLVSSRVTDLDQAAKNFVRGMISKSCAFKMVVYGCDVERNLSVRLYVNELDPDDDSLWSCINDVLCHKQYATPDDETVRRSPLPIRVSNWYEDLETVRENEARSDIGFLEFAQEYEEQTKRIVSDRPAQEEMKGVQDSVLGHTSKGRGMRVLSLLDRDMADAPGSSSTPIRPTQAVAAAEPAIPVDPATWTREAEIKGVIADLTGICSTPTPPVRAAANQRAASAHPAVQTRGPNSEKTTTVVPPSSSGHPALESSDAVFERNAPLPPNDSSADRPVQSPEVNEDGLARSSLDKNPGKLKRPFEKFFRNVDDKKTKDSSAAAVQAQPFSQQEEKNRLGWNPWDDWNNRVFRCCKTGLRFFREGAFQAEGLPFASWE